MMTNLLASLLLVAIALGGCNGAQSEPGAVKRTIIRYNQLLSDGYRSLNMNPLQEVATPEQATKLYYHMAALGEGTVKMDATLKDIQFVKVTFPNADEAAVETREKWDFTHLDIASGRKVYEERDFVYEMKYGLKYVTGHWIIHQVTTLGGEGAKK